MLKIFNTKFTLLLVFIVFSAVVYGQQNQAPAITLESPNNAIEVHLYYLQPDSYDPAKSARALSEIGDSSKMSKLAIKLKQIYDGKGLFVSIAKIPRNQNYTDSISMENFYTPFPKELPEIYVAKVGTQWKYSQESVNAIGRIHRSIYPFGADFLVKILPQKANYKVLGLAVWQWLGIALLILATYLIHLILSRALSPIINLITKSRLHLEFIPIEDLKKIAILASLVLLTWFLKMAIPALLLPVKFSMLLKDIISFFVILIIMRLALLIINIAAQRGKELAKLTTSTMDEQAIPILKRISKIIVVTIALLYILALLNVNITALIAGISIGGLALALAAQDTVKNLIGSIMIFSDKPFQLGDYVVGGNYEGTVEEIGFRTTRIRTLDTSVVSVPNGSISNENIKNMGVRKFRMFNITIGVTYDTPSEKIEQYIQRLKDLILETPQTNKEVFYVHLTSMGDSSINIMYRCFLDINNFPEEQIVKEQMYLEIIRRAESLGISFAFPSRSLYIEQQVQKETK